MRGAIALAAAALVIAAISGPARAAPPSAAEMQQWAAPSGPPSPPAPANGSLQTIAEAAIRDQLLDPDSGKFKWPDKAFEEFTTFRPALFAKTFKGDLWYGCGQVNARNRMGGYNGYMWFDVLIQNGAAVWTNIDFPDGRFPSLAGALFQGRLLRSWPRVPKLIFGGVPCCRGRQQSFCKRLSVCLPQQKVQPSKSGMKEG